jgi:HEAT repeat protein
LNSSSDENISLLIELLNDPDSKVRNTAIKTSSRKYNNEVILSLIDNLNYPHYSNQASDALELIGEPALGLLEGCFYRTGQNSQNLIKIIQVVGMIGGQRSKDILWNKIDFPDKVIVSQILLSLGESGFKASISQITRIKYAIESDIADIRWNLSALLEIGSNDVSEIIKALEWENQNDIDHIYMLLAMLYDTSSIQLVKENIESGTTEGTTYAIELLDVFLSDQLKQRVIPVLDDLSITEKNTRLEVFYPRIKLDEKLVLKFLINRDYTQTNRWTKACVLKQIGKKRIADFSLDLIAQIFNPDKLVREIAAWSLYQITPFEYHQSTLRLGEDKKRELDTVILASGTNSRLMLFEIASFYYSIPIFENIQGVALSNIADMTEEVRLPKGESLNMDEKMNHNFYIIYTGETDFFSKGDKIGKFTKGQFIGEMLASSGFINTNLIVATEPTILLSLNKELFYDLLSDNVKLADKILEFI